jgi:threonine/homoserine/homoserine lactone efflux protein
MLEIALYGFLTGLGMGLTVYGPAFFLLIRITIAYGRASGVAFSFGVVSGDFLIVLLSSYGLKQLFESVAFRTYFGLAGGVVLLILGMFLLLQRPAAEQPLAVAKARPLPLRFLQGFFFNLINPLAYLYWIGIIAAIEVAYDLGQERSMLFFSLVFLSLFLVDVGKILLAGRLQPFLTPKRLHLLNRGLGIVILVFGLQLLYVAFWG